MSVRAFLLLSQVFLSGFGFSLQVLAIKTLANDGVDQTFEFVLFRGLTQGIVCALFSTHG
jgi:hypothetical protein